MKKKNKGYARIEFIANLTAINDLTAKGHTKRSIYDQLSFEGKITMTYIHFCRFDLSGNLSKKEKSSDNPQIRTISVTRKMGLTKENSTLQQSNMNSKFTHKKNITKKDLDEKLVG